MKSIRNVTYIFRHAIQKTQIFMNMHTDKVILVKLFYRQFTNINKTFRGYIWRTS